MIKISNEVYSAKTVRKQILAEIKNGIFAECERLPRETVLSEKLGISRTQLRDVLAALEQEGFITRRLGVGTMINRHVLNVKSRMDIEAEILDIIRNNGYEPKVVFLDAKEENADETVAKKLGIAVGAKVIRVSKVCKADDTAALFLQDVFDKNLIKKPYHKKDFDGPIFQFLQEKCDVEVYMDLTQLHAVLADEEIGKILGVMPGTPLLNMEEVDYDIEGKAVFYSKQFFIDGLFEQTVLRKRLY